MSHLDIYLFPAFQMFIIFNVGKCEVLNNPPQLNGSTAVS